MNMERININTLMDEIRDVAELRTKTSLAFCAKQELLKKLMEENLKAQAYRSRLSEICVQSSRITVKLGMACEKLSDYVNVTYADEIRSLGRTKEERSVVVNSLLRSAYDFISSLESVVEMAEIVIADIDKQHYSLKLTLDALNLHVNKEHIL
jgi:hypothetical protein